jgi:hypothetical protein
MYVSVPEQEEKLTEMIPAQVRMFAVFQWPVRAYGRVSDLLM